MTKEARIYNGEKSVSSTSGADKTGSIMLPSFKLYYKATKSKLYGTGTKTDIQIDRKEQGP